MRIELRTNEDDWREMTIEGNPDALSGYAGHEIPEYIWIDLLRQAGVEVEVIFDSFGESDGSE